MMKRQLFILEVAHHVFFHYG